MIYKTGFATNNNFAATGGAENRVRILWSAKSRQAAGAGKNSSAVWIFGPPDYATPPAAASQIKTILTQRRRVAKMFK